MVNWVAESWLRGFLIISFYFWALAAIFKKADWVNTEILYMLSTGENKIEEVKKDKDKF